MTSGEEQPGVWVFLSKSLDKNKRHFCKYTCQKFAVCFWVDFFVRTKRKTKSKQRAGVCVCNESCWQLLRNRQNLWGFPFGILWKRKSDYFYIVDLKSRLQASHITHAVRQRSLFEVPQTADEDFHSSETLTEIVRLKPKPPWISQLSTFCVVSEKPVWKKNLHFKDVMPPSCPAQVKTTFDTRTEKLIGSWGVGASRFF